MRFKQIIYLISATVVVTIAAQVYTNVQNYLVNKQRFERDVQQALDLAVETYYADRAKSELIVFSSSSKLGNQLPKSSSITITKRIGADSTSSLTELNDSSNWRAYFDNRDSIRASLSSVIIAVDTMTSLKFNTASLTDSVTLQLMAKKLLASLKDEAVDFNRLNAYLKEELARKKINIDYQLIQISANQRYMADSLEGAFELSTFSKSTYLPKNQKLEMQYENASLVILKRGAFGLFISLLIVLAVVGSLLYLYKVINEQKQLAEIKNDLISNITHEFKTPIATISSAIEGITLFNKQNDPEKTKKYLGISSDQLKKLNMMVEKLLETASLDSNQIDLSLESVDVVSMTKRLIEKFDPVKGDKDLRFTSSEEELWVKLDAFHIENAVSNLIDNALKYGGKKVQVSLEADGAHGVLWEVCDNGGKIDELQQRRIFEKFYRIPTGNVHDVKGFGIGLYYSKVMVEKHGGTIGLSVTPTATKFKIKL